MFTGYLSHLFFHFILAQLICVFQFIFAVFTYKQLLFCQKIRLCQNFYIPHTALFIALYFYDRLVVDQLIVLIIPAVKLTDLFADLL